MPDCSHCGRPLAMGFDKCTNSQCGAKYDKREPEARLEKLNPDAKEPSDASLPVE